MPSGEVALATSNTILPVRSAKSKGCLGASTRNPPPKFVKSSGSASCRPGRLPPAQIGRSGRLREQVGSGRTNGSLQLRKVRAAVVPALTGVSQVVVAYEDGVRSTLASTPPAPPKGDGEVKNLVQSTYQGVTSGKTPMASAVNTFYAQAQQAIGG